MEALNELNTNPQERGANTEKKRERDLIKRNIKRVTIFGSSKLELEDNTVIEDIAKKLSDIGVTVSVGASKGDLKTLVDNVVENKGKVISIGSTKGRDAGFINENIPGRTRGVYYEGGRGAKQKGLLDMSGAYIALPGESQGTFAEIDSALDSITNFDNYVGEPVKPLIFIGDFWKERYENVLKPLVKNKDFLNHIYFIEDSSQIEDILLKYAKLKDDEK